LHDASVVDHPVDAAVRCLRSVEQTGNGGGIGDIGLRGDRSASALSIFTTSASGGAGVAGIVDDDGEAVAGQSVALRTITPDADDSEGRKNAGFMPKCVSVRSSIVRAAPPRPAEWPASPRRRRSHRGCRTSIAGDRRVNVSTIVSARILRPSKSWS
jgi:hypothetical protein